MTAPLRSTPHASALPASQTAPVAEFRCLFTHDVRRKQKRWQDGYLKFHTFNNRVMVCDQTRNHIGDTYWKDSNELQEGDELSLDKGVLVEVAEAIGITQTDLAPLLDRRTKEPAKEPPSRPTPSVATKPFQRPSTIAPNNVVRTGTQLRHKSLNTLLGTPKGPVGKAQPMKSPYEARKEKENEVTEERAPKRQKTAHRPGGWRASSPVPGEESPPAKTAPPLWARTTDAKSNRTQQARMPPVSKVITISSEADHAILSSGVTLPSTPIKAINPVVRPPAPSVSTAQPSIFDEPIPLETPKPPPARIRLPKSKPVETPKQPPPSSSPPVSASNRLTNVDFAVQPVQKPRNEPSPKLSPPRNPKAKSLRLSTGVKRGTLLCQSLPPPASRARNEPGASDSRPNVAKTSRLASKEPLPTVHYAGRNVARAETLPKLRTSPPFKDTRNISRAKSGIATRPAKVTTPADKPSEDIFDDPEIIHGLMDQQLLVPSSPIEVLQPPSSPPPKVTALRPVVMDPVSEKNAKFRIPDVDRLEADSIEPRISVSKAAVKKPPIPKKTTEKPEMPRTVSSPLESISKPPAFPSRNVPHAQTDASMPPSRPSSKSPTKPLLSTGGFRKKPKSNATDIVPPIHGNSPRHGGIILPKGPLMSTTELASLLQKPKKRTRKDDPIEDASQATSKSPARKMRRVRSENDAPIPSAAEDWEKRNLPKTSSNLTNVDVASTAGPNKKTSALAALVKRTDPRKKLQRTKSLGVGTNEPSIGVEVEADLPSPVIDKDVGPWSTEAGDLFDWRPPHRDDGLAET